MRRSSISCKTPSIFHVYILSRDEFFEIDPQPLRPTFVVMEVLDGTRTGGDRVKGGVKGVERGGCDCRYSVTCVNGDSEKKNRPLPSNVNEKEETPKRKVL